MGLKVSHNKSISGSKRETRKQMEIKVLAWFAPMSFKSDKVNWKPLVQTFIQVLYNSLVTKLIQKMVIVKKLKVLTNELL